MPSGRSAPRHDRPRSRVWRATGALPFPGRGRLGALARTAIYTVVAAPSAAGFINSPVLFDGGNVAIDVQLACQGDRLVDLE